jgi:putative methionine-R-sulfoxide reductase with GAF domain
VEEPAFALPPHEVFFGRDENPEGGGALWYRERLIAVHPGTGRDEVNLLLMAYYNALHVEAAARPEAKYVNIAVFDHAFASRAERPALGALTWKSWRSEIPEVSYPVDQPAPPGVVAAPPVPPRAEPRPAAAPAQPVQPAPKVVLAPAPAPTPEPKVVLAPAPAPTPEPKVVLAPAPAPTPEPKVVLAPAPAPQPEPRVVLAPAPAPTPEPRVVLAPAPVPTPEPRAVLAPAPPAAAPRAVAHEAPRPSAVPPTTAEVTLPPTGQTGRFRVPTPSPADLARVGRPGEDDIADILAELFDEMDGLFHCRTREASAEFALDVTMRRIPCEAGSVLLADLNAGDLIFTAVRGDSGHRLKGRRVPKGKGIVGYAARHGVAIAIADVHKDTRFTEEIDHETGFATKSVIVAPLVHDNLTYGAVELLNRKGSEMFLQAEVSIISYIASQLAEYLGTSLLASEGDYGDFRIAAPEAQGAPAPVPARPAAAAAAAPVPAPAAAQAAKAAPEVKTKTGRHPTTRAAAASRKGKKGKKGK